MTTMTQAPTNGVSVPFAKLKPGMRVAVASGTAGILTAKHNGSKTCTVLWDNAKEPVAEIPADVLYVLPPDPLDQIHPMLAKNIKDYKDLTVERLINSHAYVFEKKYDGERQIIKLWPGHVIGHHDSDPIEGDRYWTERAMQFRATTRVVGKNTGRLGDNSWSLPHLGKLLTKYVPRDGATVFDGELCHTKYGDDDEKNFRLLRSIMGSLPERAVELQKEHGPVSLRLYDILWYNGKDLRRLSFTQRRRTLEAWRQDVVDHLVQHGSQEELTEFETLVTLSPQAKTPEEKQALLDRAMTEGWEGVMAKNVAGSYTDTTQFGQRSPDLLKVKPFEDKEVIILGFMPGEGEYNQDKYGAIRFAEWTSRNAFPVTMLKYEVKHHQEHENIQNLVAEAQRAFHFRDYALLETGTCSGFTQEQEAEFRATPEAFIGKVMTVKFQQRWVDTGRMRHASFKGMRPEVAANDCIYSR